MGIVNTEITLKNSHDVGAANRGYIKPEEIRTATVTAVVDTGAIYVVIPEELCSTLGLSKMDEATAHIANGQNVNCIITHPVEIQWKDRRTAVPAMVIPGAKKVLLGALALEAMDLIINPKNQELTGAHGERTEFLAL